MRAIIDRISWRGNPMIDNVITYEQPLNEIIRACLRLEQLFKHLDHQINDTSELGTRNVIAAIINVLHLLDRPDLKAKLAKELSHQMALLARLERTPEIDLVKLRELLKQLDDLARLFIDSSGKMGQNLREVELLNNLRLHLATPGGGCSFDIPVYYYWLQQPAEERLVLIKSWVTEFNNVRLAVDLLLKLVRESSKSQPKIAQQGFYQELLDPQINLRLVRVSISRDIQAYPEISVGRHFFGVRWFSPNIQDRPTQYLHDLQFWLSHCTA